MGEFIRAKIDFDKCMGIKECGKCVRVCPVNVFREESDSPVVVEENEDECTLCNLCIEACTPEALTILKVYEQ